MTGVDSCASLALDHGHRLPAGSKKIGGRQTRNATADDDHVHCEVAVEFRNDGIETEPIQYGKVPAYEADRCAMRESSKQTSGHDESVLCYTPSC
jgi:hypothetical protein